MSIKLSDLDIEDQRYIEPHLKSFYDQVTFETRTQWIMEYEQNDYKGYSSFDTPYYMDEDQFEVIKLDLFMNGFNLYEVTKFGSIHLISKKKYSQPTQWTSNEIINLRNTNDFEEMRIHAEIIKILQSEQSIELYENDFISYNMKISLIVNQLSNLDLSLADDCKDEVEKIIIHFSGSNNFELEHMNDVIVKIKNYFLPFQTPVIGVSIHSELTEELVSIFLYTKKI